MKKFGGVAGVVKNVERHTKKGFEKGPGMPSILFIFSTL